MKKLINKYKKEFLQSLENFKGYSDLTIKSYDEVLDEAFKYIEIIEEETQLIFNIMPYRIKIAHLNPKTISRKLSAIRSFVKYLHDQNLNIILKSDESIKVAKTLPKPIQHAHIMKAISHADLEERLVIVLLYTLGLRISELASLQLRDISSQWVRVLGKAKKQRDVPLLKSTKILLEEYLAAHAPKTFLFEQNREKLSENSLRYIVTKVFKRVALKVTPHQLRHSYATVLLNNNAPIADVSELLGHSSMATTQIYTKLGSALKQQNYSKSHPLCGESKEC